MEKIVYKLDEKFLQNCTIFGKANIKVSKKSTSIKVTQAQGENLCEDERGM